MTESHIPPEFTRIRRVPGKVAGTPTIKNISVFTIVGFLEDLSDEEMLDGRPGLVQEDLDEARAFVGWLATLPDDEILQRFHTPYDDEDNLAVVRDFARRQGRPCSPS